MGERKDRLNQLDEVNSHEGFEILYERMLGELETFPQISPAPKNDPEARKAELFGKRVRISPFQVDVQNKQKINKFTITVFDLDLDDIHSLSRIDDPTEIGTIIQNGKTGSWQLKITVRRDQQGNLVTACRCNRPNESSMRLDFVLREVDELEYVWDNLTLQEDLSQANKMKGDGSDMRNKDFGNGGAWSRSVVEPKSKRRKR